MAHNAFAKSVKLWTLSSSHAENIEEYQRLERQHNDPGFGAGGEVVPPPVYEPVDQKAAAAAAQKLIDEAAVGMGEITEAVPEETAAKKFWVKNSITNEWESFDSEQDANNRSSWLTAQAALIAAETPPEIIEQPLAPAYVPDAPLGYSALDPWTGQMVPGFDSQAQADKTAGQWQVKWNEEQASAIEAEQDAAAQQAIITQGIEQSNLELGPGATGAVTMAPPQIPGDWTGGMGDWGKFGSGFGALEPRSQYTAMMRQALPGYQMPGYESMAMRGFAPTWGSYMLGQPEADRSGSVYNLQTPLTGGTAPAGFGNWYAGRNPLTGGGATTAYPLGLGGGGAATGTLPGWNRAVGLSGQVFGGEPWNTMATGNIALSEAMQEADAVQAMALGQYYGGGGPRGGYAGRMVERGMQNLFNRWQAGAMTQGITQPSGFLNYLSGLDAARFPGYVAPQVASTAEPAGTVAGTTI